MENSKGGMGHSKHRTSGVPGKKSLNQILLQRTVNAELDKAAEVKKRRGNPMKSSVKELFNSKPGA